ncbi:MAG: NAD(P)H-hydrate dehydratase [Gammaproteobacteria bacterium]
MEKLPINVYRAEQIRELDRIAIEERGIPGFLLMSRAGRAAFEAVRARWPEMESLAVFCGSGNNAGDGYVLALEAMNFGMDVHVYSVSPPDKLTGDALAAQQAYLNGGGAVKQFDSGAVIKGRLIVDALLGTGLDREVGGVYLAAVDFINSSGVPVVALDIPSGLNADSGCPMGKAVRADCTVTFIGLKQGLFTAEAADFCGEIVYASLEVPEDIFGSVSCSAELLQPFVFSTRRRCSHKGSHGHVLVVGGELGYSGAPRMTAEAAARVGSGLISVATRPRHAMFMNLSRPEIMCHGVVSAEDLAGLAGRATVIAIGPGLGKSEWANCLLAAAIRTNKPVVADADALNLLALKPVKYSQWVLTPHPGEAARLLNCTVKDIQRDRFSAVAAIRDTYGGAAILKGAGTLIATGDGIKIATSGNPGMASGGMGDVLTGIVAGLIAQGMGIEEAALGAVDIHGRAADIAARQGERGMLACDLMPHIRSLANR